MNPLQTLLDDQPLPRPTGSKDDRGSVVIAGGPEQCPGAVLLAAEAALRAGAGRVQLAVHPAVATQVAVAVPECLVMGWDPDAGPSVEVCRSVAAADVVVIGSGYPGDVASAAGDLARRVGDAQLVLDAGALGAALGWAAERALVLAPNTDEAAHLVRMERAEPDLAKVLGERLGGPVAVRGATTVVTDGSGGLWSYEAEASGLGTPGSGDVLIGILAGLLARGIPPVSALAWSVALHGRSGEVVERTTPVGYLARDLLAHLPVALVELGGA